MCDPSKHAPNLNRTNQPSIQPYNHLSHPTQLQEAATGPTAPGTDPSTPAAAPDTAAPEPAAAADTSAGAAATVVPSVVAAAATAAVGAEGSDEVGFGGLGFWVVVMGWMCWMCCWDWGRGEGMKESE